MVGMIAQLMPETIGGGRVRQPFTMAGRRVTRGDTLTADEIMAMPTSNRRALIETGYLHVWPKRPGEVAAERHLVSRGFGRYDVIEGVVLNKEPLSKEEAMALVGPGAHTPGADIVEEVQAELTP